MAVISPLEVGAPGGAAGCVVGGFIVLLPVSVVNPVGATVPLFEVCVASACDDATVLVIFEVLLSSTVAPAEDNADVADPATPLIELDTGLALADDAPVAAVVKGNNVPTSSCVNCPLLNTLLQVLAI